MAHGWAGGLPVPPQTHLPPALSTGCRHSPLWDQEDLYQREHCSALSVVSMPFYWPPRAGALWEGSPLAVPHSASFHPTFGTLTAAGGTPLTQQ